MATVKIDTGNFDSDVLNSDTPVVVDFWAEWCGPCKMIAPSLEEISDEMAHASVVSRPFLDVTFSWPVFIRRKQPVP